MDDLLLIEEKIDLEVRSLETCMFDHKTFSDILSRVQKAVDDLNLYSYSNLPIWVNKLDIEVGAMQLNLYIISMFFGLIHFQTRLVFDFFFFPPIDRTYPRSASSGWPQSVDPGARWSDRRQS